MPKFNDHPVVLKRVQFGWTQSEMAKRASISRSSLVAIEEGRTRTLSPSTSRRMDDAFRYPVGYTQRVIDQWFQKQDPRRLLTNQGRALLGVPPQSLNSTMTFASWRSMLAPSVTAFASLLGVNRDLIAGYEQGIRQNGMPPKLQHVLQDRLKLSPEYVIALSELEPS